MDNTVEEQFTTLAGTFKTKSEFQAFCNDLFLDNKKLKGELKQAKQDILSLNTLISTINKLKDSPKESKETRPIEKMIIDKQLGDLLIVSQNRQLLKDEVEILSHLIKANKLVQDRLPDSEDESVMSSINDQDLERIASITNGK